MDRKAVSGLMLTLLLISTLTLAVNIQPVKASGTIYIRTDGSIDPSTAPISSVDNVTYTFTDNINDPIVVERDNIVVDGAGYTLQGTGGEIGINLDGRNNITIKNTEIRDLTTGINAYNLTDINISGNNITNNYYGIFFSHSSNSLISGNNITNNEWYGILFFHSSNNRISGNNLTANPDRNILFSHSSNNYISRNIMANNGRGIEISSASNNNTLVENNITNNSCSGISLMSNYNSIVGNNLTNNNYGIYLTGASNNHISGNNITVNNRGVYLYLSSNYNSISENTIAENTYGIWLDSSSNNSIHHNGFVNNTVQAYSNSINNVWDSGYPSGGNYWSDYTGVDSYCGLYQNVSGSDGLGDAPYVINADNRDRYPLMGPFNTFAVYAWRVAVVSHSTISDVYFDAEDTFLRFNVTGEGGTTGFCRVTIPRELLWVTTVDEWNVTVDGLLVLPNVMENADYTYIYFTYTHSTHTVVIKGTNAVSSHDIAVVNVTPSETVAGQEYPVSINITVMNQGLYPETFNVTVYANTTIIQTKDVTNLASRAKATLSLSWNTTGVPFGLYKIKVVASTVLGETETADNTYMDGTITVIPWGDWKHYHDYDEIVDMLLYLNLTHPSLVDVFSVGKSWENRDIYCIRLTNESLTIPKPKVFFVGYHHARELISAEPPLYFAVEAATHYSTNETITHMLDYCEIYIVVALNVDAFETEEANEWQRKNVHAFDEDEDDLLDEDPPDDEDGDGYIENLFFLNGTHYKFIRWEGIDDDGDGLLNEDWVGGVDLNRNYGYEWNASVYSGSPYPQDEDYRGPSPFSEPETQAIRDLALQHNFKYAISFHSGIELILYPWGYTNTPTPHDTIFKEIAGNLSSLVNAPYCQSGAGLYTSSGLWDDWMYANRSTFALTCEIYGNDSAWQYDPGPDPDTWWERGIFQAFNPDPIQIGTVIKRWLPVFTHITNRAITEAYDIAANSITPIKTIVGQGFSTGINVTVTNQGDFTESFTVTVYANTTSIASQTVTLNSENSTTVTFPWNTTGLAKGNYTITAYAEPLPGETDTADNTLTDGWILVTVPGDVNGDCIADMADISMMIDAFMTYPGDPKWDPNCDVNDDRVIDMADISIAIDNFMKTCEDP